jgi:hypothetical protein
MPRFFYQKYTIDCPIIVRQKNLIYQKKNSNFVLQNINF